MSVRGEGWAEPWVFPLPWPPLADLDAQVGLRPWGAGEGDADTLAAAWQDPEVARWTAVPPDTSVESARRWIRGEESRRAQGLAMDLVISPLRDARIVLGEVGLVVIEPEKRWAEIGYWLAAEARGAGRASAATKAFAGWALRELPIDRLVARTRPDNPKAGAVAERAGLARAGELDDGTIVWVLDRPGRR
ncbi:MAG: GNAT family N-acetyltransferase [Acidimicrobiales bacterium]